MMKQNMTSQCVRAKDGFSLVELMVVLVIMGTLAAIGIPAFTVWVGNYRLKVASKEVYGAFQLAKLTAVKENADVVIWFNTGSNSLRAYVDNGAGGGGSGNRTQDGTEKTVVNKTVEVGIDMYNTSFSSWSNQTVFNSRGLASGGWGFVDLKNTQSKYKRITVWTTGHLQIQDSTDGSSWS